MKIELTITGKHLAVVGLILLGAAIGIYFAILQSGPVEFDPSEATKFEHNCTVNGRGNGECRFLNGETRAGRVCIQLAVHSMLDMKDVGATKVCSGNLKTGDVSTISFFISGMDTCTAIIKDWRIGCSLIQK